MSGDPGSEPGLSDFQQVLLGVEVTFCWKCRDSDQRLTGKKNTTIEWDDGEKGNSNLILTEIFPPVKLDIRKY